MNKMSCTTVALLIAIISITSCEAVSNADNRNPKVKDLIVRMAERDRMNALKGLIVVSVEGKGLVPPGLSLKDPMFQKESGHCHFGVNHDLLVLFAVFRSPRDRKIALGFVDFIEFDAAHPYAKDKIYYLSHYDGGNHVTFTDDFQGITKLDWRNDDKEGRLMGQINWTVLSHMRDLQHIDLRGNQLTGFVDLEQLFLYKSALTTVQLDSNKFVEIMCRWKFPANVQCVSVLDNPLEPTNPLEPIDDPAKVPCWVTDNLYVQKDTDERLNR